MRYGFKLFALCLVMSSCGVIKKDSSSLQSTASEVIFKIKDGTAEKAWNEKSEMLVVKLGDTIKIINQDSVIHRLHTIGSPCDHSPDIAVQTGSYLCKTASVYDPEVDSALYDHNYGPEARFWVKVVP